MDKPISECPEVTSDRSTFSVDPPTQIDDKVSIEIDAVAHRATLLCAGSGSGYVQGSGSHFCPRGPLIPTPEHNTVFFFKSLRSTRH